MPIFMLRAVRKSADGLKSAHVASMWPYQAPNLTEAKRFIDQTPSLGWSDADTFEIADRDGHRLSWRAIAAATEPSLGSWNDDGEEMPS